MGIRVVDTRSAQAPGPGDPGSVAAGQYAQLRRALGPVALAQAVAGAVAAWLFAASAGELAVTAWLLLVLAAQSSVLLLRGLSGGGAAEATRAPLRMHRMLRAASFANGALWGAMPWWMATRDTLSGGVAAFLVACVAGAVALTIGFDAIAALGFASAAMAPLVLWLSLGATQASHVVALLAAGYLLYLSLAVRGAQKWFLDGQGWRARALHESAQRERQARRMQRMARLNALVVELGQLGAQTDDPDEFRRLVCRVAVEHGGLSQAWIGCAPGGADDLRVAAECVAPDAQRVLRGHEQAQQARSDMRACFATLASPPGSLAALPLRGEDAAHTQVSDLLVLCLDEADAFDHATTEVLTNLGLAVQRALHALAQRGRMAQLQGLYRALMREGDVLLQARSVPDMLMRTCQTLTEGTQFHAAWVARPDEAGTIEVVARAGSGADQLDALHISLDDADQSPLVLRVWSQHRNACCNDLLGDPRMAPWRSSMRAYDWRSALATPVFRGASIWAVLVFVSPQAGAFDKATTELCQRVAELLGHGLDELDIKRRLSDMQLEESHRARHDLLTGLPNRFALTQYLPQALASAQRDGSVLAVGMLDLDDFKPVNDTWGHDVGDRLLREIGQRLRAAIRKFDVLARLGGDEFVVVIEQIDAERVLAQLGDVLRRLHGAVEQPFEIAPGCRVRVGMSMGLALFPLDAQDPEGLLRQADAAMYQVKLHKHDRSNWWQLAVAGRARLEGGVARGAPRAPAWLEVQAASPSLGAASTAGGSGAGSGEGH